MFVNLLHHFLASFTPAIDERVMLSYQDGSVLNMEGEAY